MTFRYRNELLYYVPGDSRDRLYIPDTIAGKVIGEAYNRYYQGFYRTYDELQPSVYIRGLSRKVKKYIAYYYYCQLNQTQRHRSYRTLNPIPLKAPFYTITIDFVLALPTVNSDKDCILTITYKYTKKMILIPGKTTYLAIDWANLVIVALLAYNQGIPSAIISDRDRKFILLFQRQVF